MTYRRRTVFVTGATGFVGSWLTHALLRGGARVVALVRDRDPQSEFSRAELEKHVVVVNGDLRDANALRHAIDQYEPQIVFHLGAQTLVQPALRSPFETFEINVRGTYHLLEALRCVGSARAIVIASSDKAYGELIGNRYHEDMALRGDYPYDVSKSCTDLIARSYWCAYSLPITIARCGNIYGGGDTNWSRIVPGTIRSLLAGERPIIRSDGTLVRDYLHVRDVVDAYMTLAEGAYEGRILGEAFNFSSGCEKDVLSVVTRLRELMSCSGIEPIVQGTARGEITSQRLDWSKARSQLGWEPRIDFDTGLREAIAWYIGLLGGTG